MISNRLVSTKGLAREDWLKYRDLGIGASDAAAAVGMSKYKTPFELYQEKRHEVEPEDLSENENVEMGILLEPVVAELFERRTGKRVEFVHAILQHPEYPWMLANLDRRVVGERAVLECKTANAFAQMRGDDWGDPEAEPDAVPTEYLIQVQHQLAVTGLDVAYIGVLFGGLKMRVYTINRDDAMIATLIALESGFWDKVQSGIEPDAINSEDVRRKFPTSNEGSPIMATAEAYADVQRYAELKAEIKLAEDQLDTLYTRIGNFMGEHDEIRVGDRLVMTWKTQHKKAYTAVYKESSSRVMRLVKAKAKK
jgi:putative phage-type endonuclease